MKTTLLRRTPRLALRAAGFTLVELMIAITIGMAIIASLAGILATSSSSSKTNDRASELEYNGRYALSQIKTELLQSGYRAYTWAEPNTPSTALGAVTNECDSGSGGFVGNIRQGVWGVDDANPFSATCVPTKNGSDGGDILVIRRLDGNVPATLTANTFYFRSSYAAGEVFRGTTPPATISGVTPLNSFPLQVFVYYVRPYTVSATENPKVPALMRVVLQSDGSMTSEMVATGIEQFQVQYGRRTTSGLVQYYDTFTSANCGTCVLETTNGLTTTTTVWDEVNSVRLWVLARSTAPEPGYVNNQTYAMGDINYTVNDGYRRQLFTTVVQLRN